MILIPYLCWVEKETKKEIGKFFIDIAKLLFGGLVLATILKIDNVSKTWLVIVGLIVLSFFAITGFWIINSTSKNK